MQELRIRKANIDDYMWVALVHQELSDLHIVWAPWNFEQVNPSYNIEMYREKLEDKNTLFYLVEDRDEIIAYIVFQINYSEDMPILKKRSWLFVKDLIVSKKYRWYWVWSLLLLKWEEIAKEMNMGSIELSVWNFNEEAIEFYKKRWFEGFSVKMHKFL